MSDFPTNPEGNNLFVETVCQLTIATAAWLGAHLSYITGGMAIIVLSIQIIVAWRSCRNEKIKEKKLLAELEKLQNETENYKNK